MPPARDSNTLSVSNWRTMRARPAPSAERIANSRLRTVARTSSRLATLAQEISSTSPTAPSIISSELRASPMMLSRNGPTVKCDTPIQCSGTHGGTRGRRLQLGVGLRHRDARLEQSGHVKEEVPVAAGRIKLKRQPEVGPRSATKPFPITPTTVYGSLPSEIDFPTMAGSPPNLRCHRP